MSLRQAFAHCGRFLTAASRRSMDRVSVPLWGATLSGPLPVIALVSHYLTNKLIGRRPLPDRKSFTLAGLSGINHLFRWLSLSPGQVPTCYSPVRRSPAEAGAHDLHVLYIPPALTLSQDQTLQKKRDYSSQSKKLETITSRMNGNDGSSYIL